MLRGTAQALLAADFALPALEMSVLFLGDPAQRLGRAPGGG